MSKADDAADRICSAMSWEPEDVLTDGPSRVSLTAAQVDALMEWVEPAVARRRFEDVMPTVGDEVELFDGGDRLTAGELRWISANRSAGWRCCVLDDVEFTSRYFSVARWDRCPAPSRAWQGTVA